ncbi:hypothetical protein DFJ73DRAFT_821143 [Zopfochytrium polystomum]|nr:hypothetical protein DFJ73DRAFT_821143 [Zopfochytrium polystomum]
MNSSPAFSSQPRVAPYLDSRDDRFYGYTPPGQMSFKPRSASRSTSNRTDVDAGLRSATGAERDQVDLRNFIFSGFLHKKSRLGYFQRRLFRFDGLLLICLSPKRHRLPEHINLLTFDPARHGSNQYATEFAAALRRFYPTDPPMPALTNPLIASYSADGNPEVFAKYYHIPKRRGRMCSVRRRKRNSTAGAFCCHECQRGAAMLQCPFSQHKLRSWTAITIQTRLFRTILLAQRPALVVGWAMLPPTTPQPFSHLCRTELLPCGTTKHCTKWECGTNRWQTSFALMRLPEAVLFQWPPALPRLRSPWMDSRQEKRSRAIRLVSIASGQ